VLRFDNPLHGEKGIILQIYSSSSIFPASNSPF